MSEQAYFKVEGLHKNFGGLAAVNDLTFQLEKGAIHGLIGPNGAGKTTIFNVISGFYKPSAGKVLYEGEDIGGLQPHRVAAKGLVRTFQETVLFQEFTTFENTLMGRYLHTKSSMISALFATERASERANEVRALDPRRRAVDRRRAITHGRSSSRTDGRRGVHRRSPVVPGDDPAWPHLPGRFLHVPAGEVVGQGKRADRAERAGPTQPFWT